MRKVESLSLRYVGYSSPENEEETELELAGLETLIATANQRIAVLKQGLCLNKIMKNSTVEDKNEQAISETNSQDK
ncbi:MAG: hypothetical protein WC523_00645 [Patescibacteria group bacterium]